MFELGAHEQSIVTGVEDAMTTQDGELDSNEVPAWDTFGRQSGAMN
jgi:hypothetical protein